jgi:D-glycero-alpha-D-manno-heptose-7-phosphate kinase
MINFLNFLIDENSTLREAMILIKKNMKGIVFVSNKKKKIIGSLTDGDIRSGLLKNNNLNQKIKFFMQKKFRYVEDINDREAVLKLLDQKLKIIPVLSRSKKLIDLIDKAAPLFDKKIIVRSRSPARVSLAGGGTDVTSFFFDSGGSGISFTIGMYCNVNISKRSDKKVIINSNDLNKKIIFKDLNEIKYNGTLDIIKAPIKLLKPTFGFEIFVETDVKPGSGLGGSAAVSSAVIGAINYFQDRKLSKYEISECSFQAERIELNILGGWQDQYSTVFGGCNIIEFKKDTNLVHNLILPNNINDELERRIIICDTGIPHMGSAIHNKKKDKNKQIEYGRKIKTIVNKMKSELLTGKLDDFGSLINQTWILKKKLDKKMTNSKITKLEKNLIGSDLASGCRLLGTGGGGHMLFYINPENRFNFLKKVKKLNIKYYNIKFDNIGLKVWETE